jgi:hypothetical protein
LQPLVGVEIAESLGGLEVFPDLGIANGIVIRRTDIALDVLLGHRADRAATLGKGIEQIVIALRFGRPGLMHEHSSAR